MKRSWTVIFLAATVTMASAAYGAERLRVGHDLWIGFSGVFLAQELGYFKDLGLEVDLRGFPGPGDSIPPLLAGHLDVSLTTLHNLALIAGADDAPITAIYFLDASHGADAIVAGADVIDLADLRGRDIAVTLNEANHMLLILALESVGLSEMDVNLVNMSADDAGAAFLAGRVDAAVTWEPWVSRARSGGDGRVIFSTRDVPDTIINTVSVRRDNLDRRPDALANFLKAIDQGVAFLRSEPEAAIPIIARWLEADPDDVRGMLAEDEIYGLDENRKLFGDGNGPAVQALERVISFLDERDLIRTRPGAEGLVDSRLIP